VMGKLMSFALTVAIKRQSTFFTPPLYRFSTPISTVRQMNCLAKEGKVGA
jgi:hypothetical protein